MFRSLNTKQIYYPFALPTVAVLGTFHWKGVEYRRKKMIAVICEYRMTLPSAVIRVPISSNGTVIVRGRTFSLEDFLLV